MCSRRRWVFLNLANLGFYCFSKDHDKKNFGEGKVYFILDFQVSLVLRQNLAGQEPGVGTEAETMEECYWLAPHGWH